MDDDLKFRLIHGHVSKVMYYSRDVETLIHNLKNTIEKYEKGEFNGENKETD